MTTPQKRGGLPHSEIAGSRVQGTSPTRIAALCVLPRSALPRHPLSTLSSLKERSFFSSLFKVPRKIASRSRGKPSSVYRKTYLGTVSLPRGPPLADFTWVDRGRLGLPTFPMQTGRSSAELTALNLKSASKNPAECGVTKRPKKSQPRQNWLKRVC